MPFVGKLVDSIQLYLSENQLIGGILVLLLSTVLSSASGILCKLSTLNGVEISWGLGVGGTLLSIAMFTFFQDNIEGTRNPGGLFSKPYLSALANGVVLRGLATYLYYLALDFITATDALVVALFTSIVWSTILEAIRMKITPHWLAILSAIIGLFGMVSMCKPEGLMDLDLDMTYLEGVLLSLGSGCLSSTYYVNVNKLNNVPALWHWVSYPMGLMFLTKPQIAIREFELTACTVTDRVFGFLSGLLMLLAGLTAIKGTQMTLASVSFVIKLFGIVITFACQVMLLPNSLSLNSVVGGVCIIVAMTLQFLMLSLKNKKNQSELASSESGSVKSDETLSSSPSTPTSSGSMQDVECLYSCKNLNVFTINIESSKDFKA